MTRLPLHRTGRFLALLLACTALPAMAHADLPGAATPSTLAAPAVAPPSAKPAPTVAAAKCRPGLAPLTLHSPRVQWRISPCRGGVQDARLLESQFQVEARHPPAGIAPWAGPKFAAGPLDLVETWDARWDPFRDSLEEVKLPALAIAVRTGQTVETVAVSGLEALAQSEPAWGVVAQGKDDVQLVWPDPSRVRSPVYLWKRFSAAGADKPYSLHVELAVWNLGKGPAQYRIAHEITTFQDPAKAEGGGLLGMFAGPPDHKGAGFSYADAAEHFDTGALTKPDEKHARSGLPDWLGVDARYFVLATAPGQGFPAQDFASLRYLANGVVMARLVTGPETLPTADESCVPAWYSLSWGGTACAPGSKAGSVKTYTYDLFTGPKDLDELRLAGHNLQGAVDFGWFGLIGRPMLWVLKQARDLTGSWPVAIVLLTVLIKALLWPITARSLKSMRGMQKIKPELDKMRAELTAKAKKLGQDKPDPQELNRVTFELYKKHGVNPLGGCLPMLLQLPVYISLYRTIQSSVGLYNQPLFGWIHDLTQKDPYYVLPLVLGAVMFVQQKVTPQAGGDPAQQKMMMYFMPVLFTVMMLQLPSGLTLYILVNTALGIAQTLYTYRDAAAAKA